MEPIRSLLAGAGGGNGLLNGGAAMNVSRLEKDYMGTSKEAELELGLGLSLGGGGAVKGSLGCSGAVAKRGSSAWGECGRILTAKDFPIGFCAGTKRERAAADSNVEAGTGTTSTGVSQVVGWPPIKAYRMNTLANQSKSSSVGEDKGVDGNEEDENSKKKVKHVVDKNGANRKERGHIGFVKVNMDGQQIGRKVDLNVHQTYETLTRTLDEMFFKPYLTSVVLGTGGNEQMKPPPNLSDAASEFVLTYKDKEGDWMLVGDVPWGMFVNTVKRLRVMNASEANGLAPQFIGRNEKQKGRPI